MISSALQRRVWLGTNRPVYPCIYAILVGDPGVGKGLVIKTVNDMLKHHKIGKKFEGKTEEKLNQEADFLDQLEEITQQKKEIKNESMNLLFPSGAEDITYEALLRDMGNCMRTIRTPGQAKTEYAPTGKYVHKSIYFALEELSSLFKKEADKVCKFLLVAYDAGDYTYTTKNQGSDKLRKICLNLIGGTTPGYMQETFEDKILTDGFASRTFFVFEFCNRFNRFSIPALEADQLQHKNELLEHLKNLSQLVGPCDIDEAGYNLMKDYYENTISDTSRPNKSIKLEGYYSRKNIHLQKMAMAIHFSDSTEMKISFAACKKAIEFLERIEVKMHHALQVGGNKLARVATDIIKYVRKHNEISVINVYSTFYHQVKEMEFNEVMQYVTNVSGMVTEFSKTINGKPTQMLRIK